MRGGAAESAAGATHRTRVEVEAGAECSPHQTLALAAWGKVSQLSAGAAVAYLPQI
jgi:hypothetical protein